MNLQEAILRYKKTQDPKTLAYICKIIEPFLNKHASRLRRFLPLEFDDIRQELYLVVLKRLKSYNPSKGKFLTYLCNTFKGDPTRILVGLVSKKRGGNGDRQYLSTFSLDDTVKETSRSPRSNDNVDLVLGETIEDKTQGQKVVNFTLLKGLRDTFTEREKKIFDILYHDSEVSNLFIQRRLGLSKAQVVWSRKKIKEKSKKLMGIKRHERA